MAEIERLEADNERLRAMLGEMVEAMHRYQMDSEGEQSAQHRELMRRAEALAATEGDGWRSMESAPRDGTPIITYDPSFAKEESGPYDIAYWSEEWGAFVKFGCGLDGVTLWHPIRPPTDAEGSSDE
jgi:hypothetical protein